MSRFTMAVAALALWGLATTQTPAGEVVARDDFAANEDEHPAVENGILTLDGSAGFKYFTVFDDDDLRNFVFTYEGRLAGVSNQSCFWGVEVLGTEGKFSILARPDDIHHLVKGESGFERKASYKAPGPDNPFETLSVRRRGRVFSVSFGGKRLGSTTAEVGELESIRLFSYQCTPQIKSYVLETFKTTAEKDAPADGVQDDN